jgi:hypothetical protein
MTEQALSTLIISALALPASCRVDQRVPKKMLVENGAPASADKRLINDAIKEIHWLAVLKPNTVGVAEYRDDVREYLEIAVLVVTLHDEMMPAKRSRLIELIHRAVPYPVLLLLDEGQKLTLSLAHKRWAQNEAGKVVLEGDVVTIVLDSDLTMEHPFARALALARQPQTNLLALYQSWLDCLTAWQVAKVTGRFTLSDTPAKAAARRETLRICQRLEQEGARLRALAVKEKQMAKQVKLNLALKHIDAELIAAREQL